MEIVFNNTAPALTDAAICANIAQAWREANEAACGDAGPHVAFQLAPAAFGLFQAHDTWRASTGREASLA